MLATRVCRQPERPEGPRFGTSLQRGFPSVTARALAASHFGAGQCRRRLVSAAAQTRDLSRALALVRTESGGGERNVRARLGLLV